jgi:5'-3' exonuclease
MEDESVKILLIDGNNIMFAAQYHSTKLRAADGRETTAIYGFINSLVSIQQRYRDATPMILWDHSPSWRAQEYSEYKGKRDQNPSTVKAKEAIKSQQPELRAGLKVMGVPQFAVPGMEADDLAAFFVDRLETKGGEGVLVTSDGDWIQLVRSGIHWYAHREGKTVFHETFEEDTGYLNVERFIQSKIICGDTGDNVPGLPGLGEGAAKLILGEFETVSEFLACWPTMAPITEAKGSPWGRYRKKVSALCEDCDATARIILFADRMMRLKGSRVPTEQVKTDSRFDEAATRDFFARNGFVSFMGSQSPVSKLNIRK